MPGRRLYWSCCWNIPRVSYVSFYLVYKGSRHELWLPFANVPIVLCIILYVPSYGASSESTEPVCTLCKSFSYLNARVSVPDSIFKKVLTTHFSFVIEKTMFFRCRFSLRNEKCIRFIFSLSLINIHHESHVWCITVFFFYLNWIGTFLRIKKIVAPCLCRVLWLRNVLILW